MRRATLITLLPLLIGVTDVEAQRWGLYLGSGYGFGNTIVHHESYYYTPSTTATMPVPLWTIGAAFSSGDSTVHARLSLEWDHQTWEEDFSYTDYLGAYVEFDRMGMARTDLNLVRIIPQMVFPINHKWRALLGLDLAMVVHASSVEDAEQRYRYPNDWGVTAPSAPWTDGDSISQSVDSIETFQPGLRLGVEVTVRSHWFITASAAISNTTYAPNRLRDGLVPVFFRLAVGHQF